MQHNYIVTKANKLIQQYIVNNLDTISEKNIVQHYQIPYAKINTESMTIYLIVEL